MRSGGPEQQPRVTGQGPAGVTPGGEDFGRRRPAGQRGACDARLGLGTQPTTQDPNVQFGRVMTSHSGGVGQQGHHIPQVGADGVNGQVTLGFEMTAERHQRVVRRRGHNRGALPRPHRGDHPSTVGRSRPAVKDRHGRSSPIRSIRPTCLGELASGGGRPPAPPWRCPPRAPAVCAAISAGRRRGQGARPGGDNGPSRAQPSGFSPAAPAGRAGRALRC